MPAAVCSVEYRMAPQHPHPAGVNDARDVGIALLTLATSPLPGVLGVGVDVQNYATFGISAGGYMSANCARQLAAVRSEAESTTATAGGNVKVDTIAAQKVQVSIIPMAKPNGGTPSHAKWYHKADWGGVANQYAWSVLLPGDDGTVAATWQASLLIDPPPEVVARLPPTYVQINTQDVLRDEGELYSRKLKLQGKLIRVDEYNTGHIGGIPGTMSKGGPGGHAFADALAILQQELGKI